MLKPRTAAIAQALEQRAALRSEGASGRMAAGAAMRVHVVLVGVSGSGKSTVARQLGLRTGRSVVDLDELVVKESGLSLPELLRRQGRVALLAKERALLRELLATSQPCIVAAGADTFCDATMRQWLKEKACAIHLDVGLDGLMTRLEATPSRARRTPNVGPSLRETLERQLRASSLLYREAAHSISNDGRSLDEVVDEIVRVAKLERAEHGRAAHVRRLV